VVTVFIEISYSPQQVTAHLELGTPAIAYNSQIKRDGKPLERDGLFLSINHKPK